MSARQETTTKSKRALTINDIAKLAGVSPTTVSFVLNEVSGSGISEETKNRVRSLALKLGYRPNATARLLRTNRSHTIGFVTDEIASTPFAGNVITGAQNAAWKNDKILMIVNTGRNPKLKESATGMMLERQVEGIIYAAMYHQAVEPPTHSYEAPIVLLDCFSTDRAFTSVVPDEVSGGYTATKVLLSRGHEKIGFINLTPGLPAAVGRLAGYKQALAEYSVDFEKSLVKYSDGTASGGYLCAIEMLQRKELPTAIFCSTDHVAMGAYEALKERGLHIPRDIAIVGFDNQELIAPHLRPPLSTVALPHYEMGQWAVETLIRQAEHADSTPIQHTIGCPYVERESV